MPPLTPEEQAALIRAFIGTGSGSNQINDLENLFGFSQNLLAQAAVGVPGIDAQYISDVVQNLSYQPYEGPDPLALQQDINVALRSVSERLGLSPEAVNELAASVAGGVPADIALATVAGTIYRDESGAPSLDVSEADKKDFELLSSVLSEYADAVRAEQNTFVWDGQRYIERDEADVRADMEKIGLVNQFNDPNVWLFQPDQALLAASRETEAQAEKAGAGIPDLRQQLDELSKQDRVPVVSDRDMEQGIRDFALRNLARAGLQQRRSPDVNVGASDATGRPAGGLQRQGRSDANVGAAGDGGYQGRIASTGVSRSNNRQLEQDLKAAQRYATFAAADEARKQAAPKMDDIRQQITEAGAEQNMLQAAAKMREREAQEQGSIPGAEMIDTYRDYLTASFPSVPSGGGGRRRIRLSEDQIRSVARAAAGPLRRGR